MNPESPFSGSPRKWYVAPFLIGIGLILLSILIIVYPMLLVLIIALPIFLAGVALTLVGLDLWNPARLWQERSRIMRWREWTRVDK